MSLLRDVDAAMAALVDVVVCRRLSQWESVGLLARVVLIVLQELLV